MCDESIFLTFQKQTHNPFAGYAEEKMRYFLFTFQKQMPVNSIIKTTGKKTMSCSGFKTAQNENRNHKT
jgi:hypothetical protein